MKKYEVMYILRSNLDQETIKSEVAKVNEVFTNNGSKVLEVKEWGLRELAYEIQKSRKGYYVWMLVEATPAAIATPLAPRITSPIPATPGTTTSTTSPAKQAHARGSFGFSMTSLMLPAKEITSNTVSTNVPLASLPVTGLFSA